MIGRKADEVHVAAAIAHLDRLQLKIYISYARVAVGRVANQIMANRLENLALLDKLLAGQVQRLKIRQLDQTTAHVDAKPGEHWNLKLGAYFWGERVFFGFRAARDIYWVFITGVVTHCFRIRIDFRCLVFFSLNMHIYYEIGSFLRG